MSDIREQIAKLSPEQRKQFLQRLQQEPQPALVPALRQQIPRRADPTQAPLSFAQQRMWLLDQLEPGNPLYAMTPTMRLTGPLDIAALVHSLNAIIQRHEALRATFPAVDGQPAQVLAPQLTIPLPLIDLRDHAPDVRERLAQELLVAQSRHRFDLARGPLVCARLLRLADDEHILTVMMHHIVSDGWSLGVLIRELMALYVAQTTGRPAALAALPIQYADFAAWQRTRLQGAFLEAQLSYWRAQLAGVPVLQLPTDYVRPAIQTYRSAHLPFAFAPTLTDGLKALSRRAGTTLFMTQFAIFVTLLGRLSGQPDFCVGSLVANRTQPELEGLIGFFVNNLALRVDLRGRPSAEALLRRVRAVTLGAYDHQDMPFELVLAALHPTRTASHTPLFQTMCVMQNYPRPQQVLPGLTLHPIYTATRRSGYELTFWCWEEPEGLVGELEYNPTLFAPVTIQRIAGHLRTLLLHVVATPARPISELPLLSAAEQQQLLVEWNATASAESADQCLPTLFEQQVARTPDAIAVSFDAYHLTYHELNRRANHLAQHLRGLGVGPEVRVALCMERSAELVVALLGVVQAGAAYVPIDPAAPASRCALILEASRACVLVTTTNGPSRGQGSGIEGQEARVPFADPWPLAPGPWTVVDLHADWPLIARTCPAPPARPIRAEQLLYVIATSGSTGTPKGAGVAQRGFVNLVSWFATSFTLTARDHVLLMTAFSFDLTQKNLFAPLLVGATVHLASPGPYDAGALAEQIAVRRITRLNCTPSALYPLVAQAAPGGYAQLTSLRSVFVGGEPITLARLRAWLDATHGQTELVNSYGPTECTDVVAAYRLADPAALADTPVPIGTPITQVRLVVLDGAQQLVPIGRIGELYVGGRAVGRGYLNDAALTAERFVPNPFVDARPGNPATPLSAIGSRLYRTGDLTRWQPDGQLVFVGRRDDQVKLRGFRIELGEIETVLRQHAAVRESVVLVREDTPGDMRLVAYVVPTNDERRKTNDESDSSSVVRRPSSFVSELRIFLRQRLPEYMLPAAFVFLDAFPLTPSGKIDRRALPAPDWSQRALDAIYIAPRTSVEEVIAGIWAEVLGVAQVGVTDNFFAVGGHSLLATQVIARMREAFQVELSLRVLFEAPTVAGLAAQLAHSHSADARLLPPILPTVRGGPLPLAFAQQRLWFLDQLAPGSATYTIPTPVRLAGALDLAALHASFAALVRRHETLRTTFALRDEQPIQLIAAPTPLPLAVVDLQALPATGRAVLAAQLTTAEAQRPFDLERGPLIRATLVRIAAQEHLVLLTLHHIIADGWSVGVLIRDLAALYVAAISGAPALLPALPIQYGDFALWQQQWLQGRLLNAQLAYWARQLAGAPPVLDLPLDRPRPSIQTFHGAQRPLVVPPPLLAALQTLSQRAGVTLFMMLLAAFQVLLARHSDQDDLVVGSPIAGRTQRATEGLIGFFVNTLVLRTDLAGNPSFQELLGRVREVCLGAYAHQDLPFEQLVDAMQPTRDPSRHPLFQVLFVLQNAPVTALEVPGLTLRPLPIDTQTAKFDMSLSMTESAAGLVATWEYNTDLFDATTIQRLAGQLQTLLAGIVADPRRPLAQLVLLSAAAQHQLLHEWNASDRPLPPTSVGALVAAQAARTPDAVAASSATQQLTYAALLTRTSQLAHLLRQHGAGPEVLVGLCVERSLDMLVGMLAILYAGAAYLPLDPAYPAARLAFMLRDSRAAIVLTQPALLAQLPPTTATLLCLDRDWPPAPATGTAPLPDPHPEQLAYVIYTSGSTGVPKGVLVRQRGLLNLCLGLRAFFAHPLVQHTGVLTSISFDISVNQIFPTLLYGRTLHIVADAVKRDSAALVRWLHQWRIQVLDGVPSYFQAVLGDLAPQRLATDLRALLIGGEPLTSALLTALFAQLGPAVQVVNIYGLTEITDINSFGVIGAADLARPITIGRPVQNNRVYLMDRAGALVPIGVVGEVCIAGTSMARGYLGQPALTAERFVPCPFAAGTVLCRTGDLGRRQPDGTIMLLGRRDRQVKLRGYRIELGEIEAVLRGHAAVREGAVVARADRLGELQLVAYVVPAQDDGRRTKDDEPRDPSFVVGPSSFASALRAFLTARLPGYMLPSAFVVLDGLPRTPNGKLDRRALPAPEQAGSMRESTYVAPRDLTELRLVRVWEDLLGVQPIGVHDNFFDLGGHSLLVVRLIARIQQQFGQSIPLAALFQDATIEYMATLLHQRPSDEQRSPLVALQAVGANPPFFCVHPGAGNVLCYVELAHSLGHTQPFYGLQAAGLEDAQAPRGSVEAMATAYLTALRVVQPHGPYRLGGWSFGGLVAFEMAQQLHAQGQTVALLALIDSTPPTDAAPIDEVALLAWFAHDLGRMAGNPVPLTLDELRLIAPEQRLRYLLDQARVANVLPPDIDEQQIRRGLAVFAANIQAMQRYQPQPYAGRVTLFRASVQMPEDAADPTLGWGALATDGVALYTIPGDHYSIVRPPQVRLLAEQLHACLEAVPADAPDAPDAQIDRALECALCVEL